MSEELKEMLKTLAILAVAVVGCWIMRGGGGR